MNTTSGSATRHDGRRTSSSDGHGHLDEEGPGVHRGEVGRLPLDDARARIVLAPSSSSGNRAARGPSGLTAPEQRAEHGPRRAAAARSCARSPSRRRPTARQPTARAAERERAVGVHPDPHDRDEPARVARSSAHQQQRRRGSTSPKSSGRSTQSGAADARWPPPASADPGRPGPAAGRVRRHTRPASSAATSSRRSDPDRHQAADALERRRRGPTRASSARPTARPGR